MFASFWLLIRNLAMIILFPGTVAVLIPYRLLAPVDLPNLAAWSYREYLGVPFCLLGAAILLSGVWSFARIGRGTLAPFDETRKLVIAGLYKYVRNPMYIGVLLILLGETIVFGSKTLLVYSAIVFGFFNIFIIGYEENRLRLRFGAEYRQYCDAVGRWIPGKPYSGDGQ